jgi:hypothetical protein
VRIVTTAKEGQWLKATTEYERIMAKAATQAMRDVGNLAVKNGRAVMANAGFSSEFQRTLRVIINRRRAGYVLNPSAWVHSTVNYEDVFETGKTITGSKIIWLPLPSVPPNPGSGVSKFGGFIGRAHMTPSQYKRQVGPLVFMNRGPGYLPMLGAVVEQGGKPTRRRLRQTFLHGVFGESQRGARATKITIPLFVGVPSVTIPPKFDIKGAVQDAFDEFDKFYKDHLEPYEGRK